MAKITDYASLSAAVIDHTTRDDLGDSMDRFVQLAEQAMKRRLRSLDMEVTTTVQTTSGIITVPAALLSLKSVKVDDDPPLMAAGPFTDPEASAYRLSGDTLTITPEPDEEVDVTLTYVAKFTPLEDGSNWLIEDHPDVYFYGTLSQAFSHFRDTDAQVVAESQFRNALEEVANSRNRDRYGSGVIAPSGAHQVARARC